MNNSNTDSCCQPHPASHLSTTGMYLLLEFFAVIAHTLAFLKFASKDSNSITWLFIAIAIFTYSTGYWLIMSITGLLAGTVLTGFKAGLRSLWQNPQSKVAAFTSSVAIITAASGLHFLLYADRFVYGVFGYHINSFVINLLTTPGGAESMDVGGSAKLSFALIISGIVAANIALWFIACKWQASIRKVRTIVWPWLIVLLLVSALGQAFGYGFAALRGQRDILRAAEGIPWFQPVSMLSIGRKMGWTIPVSESIDSDSDALLNYPLDEISPITRPFNIVWLVGESWRFDMLNEEISPNIWNFAQNDAAVFTHHYSSGVNTRMGLFGMFYGLHGNYWFPVLASTRPPVLMDMLRQSNYDFQFRSSAKFTYPEFDRTILAGVDSKMVFERPRREVGWKLDRYNIDEILKWLETRKHKRNGQGSSNNNPFMLFMFFESPHAGYHFPDDAIIRQNYDIDFNYATDLSDNPDQKQKQRIFNRYVNASHHMDQQIGRLLDKLRTDNLLDNTIVIITGDHGEEFHENGRWGHGGSEFHEYQMRVPLVIHSPDGPTGSFDGITNHIDIPATLLTTLGVDTPTKSYSLGENILSGNVNREMLIATAWHMAMLRTDSAKVIFPFRASGLTKCANADDSKVKDENAVISAHADELMEAVRQMRIFRSE